jgi:excisionase family DNA binding protein
MNMKTLENLSLRQGAELTGLGMESIRHSIYRGELPASKTEGGHFRIAFADLREYVVNHRLGSVRRLMQYPPFSLS